MNFNYVYVVVFQLISYSIVSKGLIKERSHRPAQKPHLTSVMNKRSWTLPDVFTTEVAEWKKLLFSDKCTMHQFVTVHMRISQPLSKHFDKKCVVTIMNHRLSQVIWNVMSCRGLHFNTFK